MGDSFGVPQLPRDAPNPFSRREAIAAGVPEGRLSGKEFRRIFRGMYVSSSTPADIRVRAQAALRLSPPGSFVSHHTAALLWGAIPPASSRTHISQASPNKRTVRQGIFAHVARPEAATTRFRGLPISTPEQTFLDIAGSGADLIELVILGDSLVKAGRCSAQGLIDAAEGWRGRHARQARLAAGYVRAGVDSAMESRLRMLIVLAGLPEPEVNVIIRHSDGGWRRRFDLCYREFKLLVEYDGRQHAFDESQWANDIYRREDLEAMGYRLIIVISRGIYAEPEETLIRIANALRERGARGIPVRLREDWRRYFSL